MFNKLLSLYQSHTSGTRTPLEQFTTEAFCGVLRSDSALLEGFLQAFAGIENETGFSVKTEISYPHNGSTCRIDVVIENRNYLIFLENKVETGEGSRREIGQLEAYANILKTQNKKTLLLFCTKYQETKNSELYKPIPFKQFLWRDIYSFISKSNFNQKDLVQLFLKYLEKQNMSLPPQLNIKQLEEIKSFSSIFNYFDECLELTKPYFKEKFSKNKRQTGGGLEVFANRYGIKQSILGSKKSNSIHVYFSWSDISTPKIEVIFWIEKSNQYWEEVRNLFASDEYLRKNLPAREGLFIAPKEWGWFCFAYQIDLDKFLNEGDQTKAIADWCKEKIGALYAFMQVTQKECKIPWEI